MEFAYAAIEEAEYAVLDAELATIEADETVGGQGVTRLEVVRGRPTTAVGTAPAAALAARALSPTTLQAIVSLHAVHLSPLEFERVCAAAAV